MAIEIHHDPRRLHGGTSRRTPLDPPMPSFQCTTCGETHDGLPDLTFLSPDLYHALSRAERAGRAWITTDLCRVDDHHFIRCTLDIPIVGHKECLCFGLWLSASEKNFERYRELFDDDDPPRERYVGYISNEIPGYRGTRGLVGAATLQPHNRRPTVELEPTDHPFAVAQREGVTLDEAVRLCGPWLHGA